MIVEAVLIGLFSWRLASLLVQEDGPSFILLRIRNHFLPEDGPVEGFWGTLFSCVWCMSVWTTITAFLLWQLAPVLVMIGAAMAVAILVDSIAKGK